MADRSAYYSFPSDNVIQDPATVLSIQTGTDPGDPNYGPDVLADGNPMKLAKILSTTAAWAADLGSSKPIANMTLVHSTADEDANLRFKGGTSIGAGDVFDLAVTVPPWLGSGTGRYPQNAFLDVELELGFLPSARYLLILLTGNSQNFWAGQWVVNNVNRRFTEDLAWDYELAYRKRDVVNETSYGSETASVRGTNEVLIAGDHRPRSTLESALIRHWYDAEGRSKSWIFNFDGVAYYGKWAGNERVSKHFAPDGYQNRCLFKETSRGLRPGV